MVFKISTIGKVAIVLCGVFKHLVVGGTDLLSYFRLKNKDNAHIRSFTATCLSIVYSAVVMYFAFIQSSFYFLWKEKVRWNTFSLISLLICFSGDPAFCVYDKRQTFDGNGLHLGRDSWFTAFTCLINMPMTDNSPQNILGSYIQSL